MANIILAVREYACLRTQPVSPLLNGVTSILFVSLYRLCRVIRYGADRLSDFLQKVNTFSRVYLLRSLIPCHLLSVFIHTAIGDEA